MGDEEGPDNRQDNVVSGDWPRNKNGPPSRGANAAAPWLLKERVTVPERVAGYFDRPKLMKRMQPTGRRVTVLKAPGGFGKTTLLAECCRSLEQDGVLCAWLTLDVQDAPHVLDAYLAFAFQNAGLDVLDVLDPEPRHGWVRPSTAPHC